MNIVFVLVPLGLMLLALAGWAFLWAVNHEQFEELDRAAQSILFEDADDQLGPPASERAPEP